MDDHLRARFSRYLNAIQPTQAQRRLAKDELSFLEDKTREYISADDPFKFVKALRAGSFAKATALRRTELADFDADIAVYVEEDQAGPADVSTLIPYLETLIRRAYRNRTKRRPKFEKHESCVRVSMRSLAHDVGVGLVHDCLASLRLFLFRPSENEPHRAYLYRRTTPGTFDISSHSGRITRDSSLVGGRFDFEVQLRDRLIWEQLKQRGKLRISWIPCVGRSTEDMCAKADGGYASAEIAFSRTVFTME